MSSNINDGILNLYIDNNINSNNSIGIKLSGKGFINNSNISYDRNGIGLQLYNNSSNIKELSIIDTSNINNTNYPTLRYSITNNNTSIKSITSNNIYKPLIINDYITITSNSLGVGTSNPTTSFDIRGNMNLVGSLNLNGNEFSASSGSLPISSATSNLISGTTSFYYLFTSSNAITFTSTTYADLLLVGAGGNGGLGFFSGGGGAGEVIYIPNFLFNYGLYSFNIGISTDNPVNRISRISYNNNTLISANGGGDGGYNNISFTGLNNNIFFVDNNNSSNYISFLNNGTLNIFSSPLVCDILVIGGGGGGGGDIGGGGGAGGVVYQKNVILNPGKYEIIVGNGGAGPVGTTGLNKNDGANGESSQIRINNNIFSFNGIIFEGKGGGGGGNYNEDSATSGKSGGSGGGGSENNNNSVSSGGSTIQGNTYFNGITNVQGGYSGSSGVGANPGYLGGGGGGAGGTSENANGGQGIQNDITGKLQWYVAGGGAGSIDVDAGKGGNNIGGDGHKARTTVIATKHSGTNGTGSGGGGGGYRYTTDDSNEGGSGGSGIVIIRFSNLNNIISPKSGGSGGGGFRLLTSSNLEYPPKAFDSYTNEITTTFLGSNNIYYQKLTLNNTNISYGSGDYEIYSSSSFSGNITKELLFNKSFSIISEGAHFALYQYNSSTGVYKGSNYIISDYLGDWIIIKLPEFINLSKFSFYARNGYPERAPGLWRCYGSSNGINFYTITEASNESINIGTTSYIGTNLIYTKELNSIAPEYNYIGFTISRLAGAPGTAELLNMNEIILYGNKYNIYEGAISGIKNNNNSLLTSGNNVINIQGGNGGSALSTGSYSINITGTNINVGLGGLGVGSLGGGINGINYGDGGSGNGGLGRQGLIIVKISISSSKILNIKSDNINVTNLNINCNLTIGGIIYKSDGTIFVSSSTNNYISSQWKNQLNNIYYDKGFVGIGINNPISQLHLSSTNVNSDVILRFTDASTGFTSNDGLILEKDSSQSGLLWNYENADLIFGTFNKERLRIKNNGNIGIGTTNPQALLDIRGNVILSGSLLRPNGTPLINVPWSNSSINTNNIFYNLGNVGIGTTNPISLLDIRNGNIVINNGNLGIGITNPISQLHLSSNINSDIILRFTDVSTGFTSNDGLILEKDISNTGLLWNYENADLILGTNNQERLRIKNTGNIGIGTTNPQALLDIRGNVILSGSLLKPNGTPLINVPWSNSTINNNNIFYNLGNVGIGTTNPISLLDVRNGNVIINNGNLGIGITNPISQLHLSSNINSDIILRFTDASTGFSSNDGLILEKDISHAGLLWNFEDADLIFGTNNQERLRLKNNGNIGIGTNNPQALLDIRGNVILSGSLLKPNGSPVINVPWSNSSINNNNIFYNLGNVGIGTTNPISLLDVRNGNVIINNGNLGIGTTNPISQLHLSSTINSDIILRFTDVSTGNTINDGFILEKDITQTGLLWNFENADLILGTNSIERLRIKNTGNIGIGTTNPQALLDIRGNVILSGSLLKPNGTPVINVPWSNSSINNNNIYYSLGNVGIGTTNPISLLDVRNGNVVINNGNLGIGITNPVSQLHLSSNINSDIIIRLSDSSTGFTNNDGLILEKDITHAGLLWNFENADLILGTNNQERLRIKNTGNIGIGLTNPQSLLDVNGTISCQEILVKNTNISNIIDSKISSTSNILVNYNNLINKPDLSIYATNTSLNNKENPLTFSNGLSRTTNTISLLYDTSTLRLNNGSLQIINDNKWITTGNNIYFTGGNVGIGIASPTQIFQVGDGGRLRIANNSSDYTIIGTDSINNTNTNTRIELYGSTNTGSINYITASGDHVFYTSQNGLIIEALRIRNNGNVGIGTSNPLSRFHVIGDIRLSGNLLNNSGNLYINIVDWVSNSTNIYYNNGSVAIGKNTNDSTFKLEVINNAIIGTEVTQRSSYDHSLTPLTITNTNATSTNNLTNDIRPVLSLCREGTSGQAYGARATFKLCRYENSGNNSRTRLDLDLSHDMYDDVNIMTIRSDKRIGINNNNPQSTLDIGGDIRVSGNLLKTDGTSYFKDTFWSQNGNNIFYNLGNVGIGTSSPTSSLHINGDIRLSGNLLKNDGSIYTISINQPININSNIFYYNNSQLNISNFNINTSGSIKTLDLNTNITNINNLNVNNNLYIGQKIGIFVNNPSFPLEISSSATLTNTFTSSIGLLGTGGSSVINPNYISGNIVLKANGAIWSTSSFIASSDSRIKNNINDIDDNIALQKILKIEPKTYNYIDFLSKGTCNVYGFIAQQIKEHIPEAITIQNEFIPNIYKIGKIINNNIITDYDISSNIKIYDSIKIITDNEVNDYMIIDIISSNSFIIDKNIETTKDCIIYGTKINDFHTLDKSYIYTLNVCATQDLFKIIQKQQNEINNLELSINNLLNIVLDSNTSNSIIDNNTSNSIIDNNTSNSIIDNNTSNSIIDNNTSNSIIDNNTSNSIIDNNTSNSIIDNNTSNSIIDNNTNNSIIDNNTSNSIIDNNTSNSIIDNNTSNSIIDNNTSNSIIDNNTSNSIIDNNTSNSIIDNNTNNSIIDNNISNSIIDNNTSNSIIDNNTSNSIIDNNTSNSIIDNNTSNSIIDNNTNNSIIDNNISNSIIDNNTSNSIIDNNTSNSIIDNNTSNN